MIAEQLEKADEDIVYFEMIKQQVMQASPEDIEEIREELAELGFLKARKEERKEDLRNLLRKPMFLHQV